MLNATEKAYLSSNPIYSNKMIILHSYILMRVLSEEVLLSYVPLILRDGVRRKKGNQHVRAFSPNKTFIGISKCVQEQRVQSGIRETSPEAHICKGQSRKLPLPSPSSPPFYLPREDPRNTSGIPQVSTFTFGLVFIYRDVRHKSEKWLVRD